ncbi:hypothetical protein GJA_1338 [Janthinobacterium agaricidamnosum NBRC 102515 = DSM 9628]|uniref:Uncharacterized protein n=2 Tax=Janthinobacterium agaricidamnosum TaxID=55508 RepID=W0V338_9BURK|nr:hypothetical protein GJA_1338 [Janthinobacterium agaricidamnosum NBRC 102515 = DSM 9628]
MSYGGGSAAMSSTPDDSIRKKNDNKEESILAQITRAGKDAAKKNLLQLTRAKLIAELSRVQRQRAHSV